MKHPTRYANRILLSLFAATMLHACGGEIDPAVTEGQNITGNTAATSWQWRRAALFYLSAGSSSSLCTATIVGRRHVLTAAHCNPSTQGRVYFYTDASHVDGSTGVAIERVTLRPGVDPAGDHLHDSNGVFADFAVLTLRAEVPSSSEVATMEWAYPGEDEPGFRVGAGQHNGNDNLNRALQTNSDETLSPDDDNGKFHTRQQETNPGDSGGPFYVSASHRLLGVLWGKGYAAAAFRDLYTSVPRHLAFILDTVRPSPPVPYQVEAGGVPSTDTVLSSASLFYTSSAAVCQYACDHTDGCDGYSWVPATSEPSWAVAMTRRGAMCFLRRDGDGPVTRISGAVSRSHCMLTSAGYACQSSDPVASGTAP